LFYNLSTHNTKIMIVLLSPAKTLDYSESPMGTHSEPRLLKDSSKLVKVLKI